MSAWLPTRAIVLACRELADFHNSTASTPAPVLMIVIRSAVRDSRSASANGGEG